LLLLLVPLAKLPLVNPANRSSSMPSPLSTRGGAPSLSRRLLLLLLLLLFPNSPGYP
jgi:hypothetical protein